jgi:DNA phosphorothioation-dependent restriction protein DptH
MALPENTRERVKELIGQGKTTTEIADALGIGKMQVAGIKAHLTKQNSEGTTKPSKPHDPQLSRVPSKPVDAVRTSSHWSNLEAPRELNPQAISSSILIGTDETFNRKVYWDFESKTGSTNPHVLIVGETGFGKTYATQCIITELNKKGIPILVFDYGQGFGIEEASKLFLELTRPYQIEASRNGININPLRPLPDDAVGPVNVAHRIADIFCRIFPRMGIQQKEALTQAVELTLEKAGIYSDTKESWTKDPPDFQEVHKNLRAIAGDRENPLRSHAMTAYSHVSSFFRFRIIRSSGEILEWAQLIERRRGNVWIMQLKGLDRYISVITTEMLLWDLIYHIQSRGPSAPQLFVVLDEAHKLSFDPGTPVDWILREGRKFGIGLIIASQQLSDYSSVALANTSTKIVFQNSDDGYQLSKFLSKKCRNISDFKKISHVITTLERGKAFLLSENTGRVVEIDGLETRRVV